MKTLFLILALAVTANAQEVPDKWQFLAQGTSTDGVINAFMAPSSITRNGDKIKVWARFSVVYGYPLRDVNRNYLPSAKEFKTELILDCKAKTVKNGKAFVYDASDNLIMEYKFRDTAKEKRGTVSWIIFEYFCERGERATKAPVLKS